jgi:hypothetical protein
VDPAGSKLVGSGAVGNAEQGSSVGLSADGNTAVVGGPNDNSTVGAMWVFTRSGGVWTQQGSKLVGTPAGSAYQGHSVALSGDGNTAIVGGYVDNNPVGAAWVFVGPTLQVSPTTDIVAVGNQGGPFAPSSFQYQLSASAGTVNYSISGVPNWLSLSSTSGNVSSSGTTITFTVNANATGLAPGTYGPTAITFTNTDTGQGTTSVTATLTVNPPALQVTPTTNIAASGTQGGPFSPSSFSYVLSFACAIEIERRADAGQRVHQGRNGEPHGDRRASIQPVDCAAKASALSAALPASVPVIAGWQ